MERLSQYLRPSQHRHNAESHLYAAIKEVHHLELVSSKKWTETLERDNLGEQNDNVELKSAAHAVAGRAAIQPLKSVPYQGWYALDAVKARLQQLEMSVPQKVFAMKSDGQKPTIADTSHGAKETATTDEQSRSDGTCNHSSW